MLVYFWPLVVAACRVHLNFSVRIITLCKISCSELAVNRVETCHSLIFFKKNVVLPLLVIVL